MSSKQSSTSGKTRIFLVDDHPIVRRGFHLLLNLERDMMVCGEADNGPVALQRIIELKPDVAVVDLSLKASSGLDLIKQVREQCPRVKLLVCSMRSESIYAERALRAGADGYMTKEESTEKAVEAIRLLMRGKRYFSQTVAEHIFNAIAGTGSQGASPIDTLSDRELEVLELLGSGLGSREIADRLHVSLKTIESHREHIKTKLGLGRAAQLVSYAFNWVHSGRTDAPGASGPPS